MFVCASLCVLVVFLCSFGLTFGLKRKRCHKFIGRLWRLLVYRGKSPIRYEIQILSTLLRRILEPSGISIEKSVSKTLTCSMATVYRLDIFMCGAFFVAIRWAFCTHAESCACLWPNKLLKMSMLSSFFFAHRIFSLSDIPSNWTCLFFHSSDC